MKKLLLGSLLLVLFVSCGKVEVEGESSAPTNNRAGQNTLGQIDISRGLEGNIDGYQWDGQIAIAKKYSKTDEDYIVTIFDKAESIDCFSYPEGRVANFSSYLEVGKVELGMKDSISFAFQDSTGVYQNNIAIEGYIEILSHENDKGRMAIKAFHDEQNYIAGTIDFIICK